MQISPAAAATILPMPAAAQHALAAASAFSRAGFLLNPIGIPEDPKPADLPGAREAFEEAVLQLQAALVHADGLPGREHVEAALEEAKEALMFLNRPGVTPPIAEVIENAWRGGELARDAVTKFGHEPMPGGLE